MTVITGLEQFLRDRAEQGPVQNAGLVTHAAAVRADLSDGVEALRRAGVELIALFSPEHGLHGAAADGAAVPDTTDPRSGLPVYSLYGEEKAPPRDILAQLGTLIFDMQDVGVRFYTYISTLFYVLEAAGQAGVPVIVLDRPNPLDGLTLEGPMLEPAFTSFVGIAPLPIRYALTIGELARYMNDHLQLGADLTVVPMEGWRREMTFADTGLTWVPTSPAMPHVSTSLLYPGMCLLEGTNLSEGRGTALPFEICGAPWIDGHALAARLNALELPGVRFRPVQFVPAPGTRLSTRLCGGVQVHVLDPARCRPVTVGLNLIATVRATYSDDFRWREQSWEGAHPHFDLLMGTRGVREALDDGADVRALAESWAEPLKRFASATEEYHLYR